MDQNSAFAKHTEISDQARGSLSMLYTGKCPGENTVGKGRKGGVLVAGGGAVLIRPVCLTVFGPKNKTYSW